jgi:6-phosphogluconolactonase
MNIEILDDAEAAARRGAEHIAEAMREAVAARGRFVLAVSGGKEPWPMYRQLASMDLPWDKLFVVQVDERVAPRGHAERNFTPLEATLLQPTGMPKENVEPMPVEESEDLEIGAARYAGMLVRLAGAPPVIDLVHLGVGTDGHTASLVPGDAVLDVRDSEVAVSGVYQGRRRMTLTFPAINRARRRLWYVVGEAKASVLARLVAADAAVPCGRIAQENTILVADAAAGRQLAAAQGAG